MKSLLSVFALIVFALPVVAGEQHFYDVVTLKTGEKIECDVFTYEIVHAKKDNKMYFTCRMQNGTFQDILGSDVSQVNFDEGAKELTWSCLRWNGRDSFGAQIKGFQNGVFFGIKRGGKEFSGSDFWAICPNAKYPSCQVKGVNGYFRQGGEGWNGRVCIPLAYHQILKSSGYDFTMDELESFDKSLAATIRNVGTGSDSREKIEKYLKTKGFKFKHRLSPKTRHEYYGQIMEIIKGIEEGRVFEQAKFDGYQHNYVIHGYDMTWMSILMVGNFGGSTKDIVVGGVPTLMVLGGTPLQKEHSALVWDVEYNGKPLRGEIDTTPQDEVRAEKIKAGLNKPYIENNIRFDFEEFKSRIITPPSKKPVKRERDSTDNNLKKVLALEEEARLERLERIKDVEQKETKNDLW